LPSTPNIGTLVHLGLEAYYRDSHLNPAQLVSERAEQLVVEYPELEDQVREDAEMATIMLEGYLEWVAETGADYGLVPVGTEQMVEAEVGPFILRGKIDARMRRESDGALLQLEHKTVGNFTDIPSYAQSAPQFLTYDLLAFLTKPDGVPTDGVIINMLRRVKRTARAKPPFYMRHEVHHNLDELRAHYKHVIGIGEQIQAARARLDDGVDHHIVCPPNVNRNHVWACPCHEVCTMFDDGSDVEAYLAEFYEEWNPMKRYEHEEVAGVEA
jgi:hypothetical protein